MGISTRVKDRITAGLKLLVPIVEQQKARDVAEADTVTLVKDLFAEVFGYDKYTELTGELCIRGTYCDLAIKIDDKIDQLVEVKAAGAELDERHVKQVVDYAANHGADWVVLTNASVWRLYEVQFTKPIDRRLLTEVDLTKLDPRKESTFEALYPFCKEGFSRGARVELRDRQDATSRFTMAALLVGNAGVLKRIRRELRRTVGVQIDPDVILKVLKDEVIKRDVLEGPQADAAIRQINRRESRALVKKRKPATPNEDAPPAAPLQS